MQKNTEKKILPRLSSWWLVRASEFGGNGVSGFGLGPPFVGSVRIFEYLFWAEYHFSIFILFLMNCQINYKIWLILICLFSIISFFSFSKLFADVTINLNKWAECYFELN